MYVIGEERCRAIGIGKAAIAEVADRTAAAIKLQGIKFLGSATWPSLFIVIGAEERPASSS